MARNEELFRAIADAVDAEPERYDQAFWARPVDSCAFAEPGDDVDVCGTAFCIAGWACALSGLRMRYDGMGEPDVVDGDGNPIGSGLVDEIAAQLLGLSEWEAVDLFAGGWKPARGLSVGDALRRIGGGDPIGAVSWSDDDVAEAASL